MALMESISCATSDVAICKKKDCHLSGHFLSGYNESAGPCKLFIDNKLTAFSCEVSGAVKL